MTTRTEGLESQIDTLDDDRERLNSRLEIIEARYRSQFIALDSLVSQLQSVGNFLTQQLANLPGPRRSDN